MKTCDGFLKLIHRAQHTLLGNNQVICWWKRMRMCERAREKANGNILNIISALPTTAMTKRAKDRYHALVNLAFVKKARNIIAFAPCREIQSREKCDEINTWKAHSWNTEWWTRQWMNFMSDLLFFLFYFNWNSRFNVSFLFQFM